MLKMLKHCKFNKELCFLLRNFNSSAENQVLAKKDNADLMNFNDIPGPKSYPFVGTLYKYLPFIDCISTAKNNQAYVEIFNLINKDTLFKLSQPFNAHVFIEEIVPVISDHTDKAERFREIVSRLRPDHMNVEEKDNLITLCDYDTETLDKVALLNWKRYGNLVREVPGVKVLHVYDPDDIALVFRQDGQYPARRSHMAMLHYRTSKPHVYNNGGLLSTNGPEWWRLRSTFQKNFTGPQSVKVHVEATDNVVSEFVQWIKESKVSSNDDFLPYLNRLNLEVIGKVAFNEKFQSFTKSEQEPNSRSSKLIAAAFGSNSGVLKLDKGFMWKLFKTPLYKRLVESQDYLEKIATEILLERINFFENDDQPNKSLLQSFLKLPNLDMKDIVGMMVDILMAAIDTTSYATSFALYHLARNSKCQEIMFQEVKNLLPAKDSEITVEVLSKAVYARSVIKESLRLNPVSIGVGRQLQKDITLRGYLIPKGTVIVTQNMLSSRQSQYVNNPLSFTPERWLRGSVHCENIHPFLSLPFGFGARSCIARRLAEQNMSITLIRLIREFELQWKGGELGIRTLLINKPDQPVTLSLTPRNI